MTVFQSEKTERHDIMTPELAALRHDVIAHDPPLIEPSPRPIKRHHILHEQSVQTSGRLACEDEATDDTEAEIYAAR
jgi:hypothetical protein